MDINQKQLLDVINKNLEDIDKDLNKEDMPKAKNNAQSSESVDKEKPSTINTTFSSSEKKGAEKLVNLDRQSVVKGFIYSEVLGKPRALRRWGR